MALTLSVLLSLGLCLGLGTGVKGTFSRPSLWAEPSSFIPVGTNVTFWCRGSAGAKRYCLSTPRSSKCSPPSWPRGEGKFLISSATKEDAGHYRCFYPAGSQSSHPLELVLTGIHEKPSLWAQPGPLVGTGEDVTLRCRAKSGLDRFALYKDGVAGNSTSFEWTSQADFLIPAATPAQEGTYRCYSFSSSCPHLWSAPSDPLKLSIVETSLRPRTLDDQVAPSGLLRLQEGILIGVSLLLFLLFLVLFLLFHRQYWDRFETQGNEAQDNETLQSCSPVEAMQEQILYTAVKNSRQNRPKHPAAGDLQEVTYTQVTLNPSQDLAWAPLTSPLPTGHPGIEPVQG